MCSRGRPQPGGRPRHAQDCPLTLDGGRGGVGGQFINGGNGKYANATMITGSGIIRVRNGRGAKGVKKGEEIRMPYGKAHWEADARVSRARRERRARQALTDLLASVTIQNGRVRLRVTLAQTAIQDTGQTLQHREENNMVLASERLTKHDATEHG